MPDIIEQYGGFGKLDVRLNTPWINYEEYDEEVVEDLVKDINFIRIAKKGIKSILTMPLELLIEEDKDLIPEWRVI